MEALLVSRKEAARVLSVSRGKLDQLISKGTIQARRIGRRVLVPREELERFARGERIADAKVEHLRQVERRLRGARA